MPDRLAVIDRSDLQTLFDVLSSQRQLLAPILRDNMIVLDEVRTVEELPLGWVDHQDGGHYRLEKTERDTCFGYTLGQQSWKKVLHPARQTLWSATRNDRSFSLQHDPIAERPRVLFGVRPCELAAIAVQDRVFLDGPYVDTAYRERRRDVCIVAVNCTRAGSTCFCASIGTGPRATSGFDLALTEVIENGRHFFVAEVGTPIGAGLLADVPNRPASDEEVTAADRAIADAAEHMGRSIELDGLHDELGRAVEYPRWNEIAERCLTCGNCTMVCPTCFCTNIEDRTDLTGDEAARLKKWDSCFTIDFSYICGGSIRPSAPARYRQWLMHKLVNWVDQFGTLGCVGCGRCITWCPVGIDITEEARIIRQSETRAGAARS